MNEAVFGAIGVVIGCFVGLAGWLAGRDRKISADAEWKGSVNSKLDTLLGIRFEVSDLRSEVKAHGQKLAVLESRDRQAVGRIQKSESKV